jgi:hypothetical protein
MPRIIVLDGPFVEALAGTWATMPSLVVESATEPVVEDSNIHLPMPDVSQLVLVFGSTLLFER